MSGKPAARQGDMTQYGGSIVQGSAGVRIGAPTGVACSVCPGGVTSGHPVKPTSPCPPRCRSSSPAPTAVTGQKRPRRWGASAPAGKCLRISAYSCAITH
ncbi:rhsB element core protein RshB [Shigella sonnei]|nr:rhsB element core protein RshB [Shigella sonnei]